MTLAVKLNDTMKKIFVTGGSGFFGANLIPVLLETGWEVCNYDTQASEVLECEDCFYEGSIMDADGLYNAVRNFQPDVFIHLAARTDCDENTTVENDYQVNVVGTQNVLDVIAQCKSVQRLIMTSTQYVCGPGRLPKSDTDYFPHTVYGQSKVLTEQLTRDAQLDCAWTIIRPVNVWGPYHARYGREFWRIADKGLYVHPGVPSPTRTYGYIGNVAWQILKIVEAEDETVSGQVFYVGDKPISIDKWVFAFCKGFTGKEPVRIPASLMKVMAIIGDGISVLIQKPFYINSSRLSNMMEDYYAPMDKTFEVFGETPYSLEDGVQESIAWYKSKRK